MGPTVPSVSGKIQPPTAAQQKQADLDAPKDVIEIEAQEFATRQRR
jgi:hypothetical protein